MAELRTYNLNLNEKTLQEAYQVMIDNPDKDILFDWSLRCGDVYAYLAEDIDPETFYVADDHVAMGFVNSCLACEANPVKNHKMMSLQGLVDRMYTLSRYEVEKKVNMLQDEARFYKKYLRELVKADDVGLYNDFITAHQNRFV